MTIEKLVKNSTPFVVPKGSVPYAQQTIISPYNDPVYLTSTTSHSNTLIILTLSSPVMSCGVIISSVFNMHGFCPVIPVVLLADCADFSTHGCIC
jgi:hypothetical protein